MIEKGVISTIEGNEVRVILPKYDDIISYKLGVANHINIKQLKTGDNVLIAVLDNDFKNGVIIAELR